MWHNNLGDGVLCWVWDDKFEHERHLEVVINYHWDRYLKYVTRKQAYTNAEPIFRIKDKYV